jgi:hypothetical protein
MFTALVSKGSVCFLLQTEVNAHPFAFLFSLSSASKGAKAAIIGKSKQTEKRIKDDREGGSLQFNL